MSAPKEALQAVGILVIAGAVGIGALTGSNALIENSRSKGIKKCADERKITEDALRRERDERSIALTAALYLANMDDVVIQEKAASVTVCVSNDDLGVGIVLDQRLVCDETWSTVTFPIIYRWDGNRTIGRPSIGTDIEAHAVATH